MTVALEKVKAKARVSKDLTQIQLLRAEYLARLRGGRDRQIFADFENRYGVCAMGLANRILVEQETKIGGAPIDWVLATSDEVGRAFGLSRKRVDEVVRLNDDMQVPFRIIADVLEFWWQKERDKAAKKTSLKLG